jgi:hypothetical protein
VLYRGRGRGTALSLKKEIIFIIKYLTVHNYGNLAISPKTSEAKKLNLIPDLAIHDDADSDLDPTFRVVKLNF